MSAPIDWLARYGIPEHRFVTLIQRALEEDAPLGDITTRVCIPPYLRAQGILRAKTAGVLAGVELFIRTLDIAGGNVRATFVLEDGTLLSPGQTVVILEGNAHGLLLGERLALNLVQRLSGIATCTRRIVDAVRPIPVRILDTRKTTPLWRWAEKYAVRVGGGHNHRMSLSDGVLIKDNHIALVGGIRAIAEHWQRVHPMIPLAQAEIEVRSIEELEEALHLGFRRFLLDNMRVEDVRRAVELARSVSEDTWLEVSGGIDVHNVRAYAETGVNAISIGALTHSAPALDMHFKLSPHSIQGP